MKKRIIAFLLLIIVCLTTIISPLSVHADNYVKDGTDDAGNTYYIVDGKSVSDLFNFSIKDAIKGPVAIMRWVFTFKTFVVLKEYKYDSDGDGTPETFIKGYWNTPNLQMLARNLITKDIDDGYTDDTWNVNDDQWIVAVGDKATKVNAITKYGFKLPSYSYNGEFPKEYMSVHNILPTSFWDAVVRFFRALFGLSFLNPPNADNYKTITYWNHEYTDKEEYLIQFFQKYYYEAFYKQIETGGDGFKASSSELGYNDKGAKDYLDNYSSQDLVDAALEKWNSTKIPVPDSILTMLGRAYYDYYVVTGNHADGKNDVDPTKYDYNNDDKMKQFMIDKTATFTIFGIKFGRAKPDKPKDQRLYSGSGAYNLATLIQNVENTLVDKNKPFWYAYSHDSNFKNEFDNYYREVAKQVNKAIKDKHDNTYWLYPEEPTFSFKTDTSLKALPGLSDAKGSKEKVEWTTKEKDADGNEQEVKHEVEFQYYKYSDVLASRLYGGGNKGGVNGLQYGKINLSWFGSWISEDWKIYGQDNLNTPKYLPDWAQDKETFMKDFTPIIEAKNEYDQLNNHWKAFQKKFNVGKESDKDYIHYNQCLIENQGEDKECWTKAQSPTKATIAIGDLWVTSGLYKIVDMSKYESRSDKTLDHDDAVKVILTIQSYCGPYYTEVMTNLLIVMEECAKNDGRKLDMNQYVDFRVMPYDIESMTNADKQNFTVADPRVEIYRQSLVGSLVADLTIRFGFKITPQKTLLGFAGKITELSVVFQQFINFDLLDGWGLSPTNIWTDAWILILVCVFVAIFMFKTVSAVYKLVKTGSGNQGRVFVAFLLLLIEIGMFTALLWAPDQTWGVIKNTSTKIMTLGEEALASDDNIAYLFGDGDDKDPATLYYLPYLDAWSIYNTGYGLFEKEQLLANASTQPETMGLTRGPNWDTNLPKIGPNYVKHWSIVLLDAFEYNGKSSSLHGIMKEDPRNPGNYILVNGKTINNNAYRVVDHFLAPRVNITSSGGDKVITTTENENYNGQFQSGIINLIPKLMAIILLLFISLIKLLVFIWFWFMLYIFIFQSVISKVNGKSWKEIFAETFSPLLYMIFIGLYAGLIVRINGLTTGIMAILIMIFMYILTIILIKWWSKHKYFPRTVKPIALLVSLPEMLRQHRMDCDDNDAQKRAAERGLEITDEDMKDPDKYRNKLFNEDGSMKAEFQNKRGQQLYRDWIKHTQHRISLGEEPSIADKNALSTYNKYINPENDPKKQRYDLDTFKSKDDDNSRRSKRKNRDKIGQDDDASDNNEQQSNENSNKTKDSPVDEDKNKKKNEEGGDTDA